MKKMEKKLREECAVEGEKAAFPWLLLIRVPGPQSKVDLPKKARTDFFACLFFSLVMCVCHRQNTHNWCECFIGTNNYIFGLVFSLCSNTPAIKMNICCKFPIQNNCFIYFAYRDFCFELKVQRFFGDKNSWKSGWNYMLAIKEKWNWTVLLLKWAQMSLSFVELSDNLKKKMKRPMSGL